MNKILDFPIRRIIEGHVYFIEGRYEKKKNALDEAVFIRRGGEKARVIKMRGHSLWAVYTRK